jgi:benzylsuccinate CoA-transferase BbsE subunit
MASRPNPESTASFIFLNASKKSVVIDIGSAAGREQLSNLARKASVMLVEAGGPLYDDLPALRALTGPRAIITSISPFGRAGPRANDPASDLVLQAAGGIAWLSGRPDAPPLRLPEGQVTMITGVYAAVATALALFDAETGGDGHDIDVSAQECIAHSLQNSIQVYDFEDRVSRRGGEGTRDATEDMFPCRDGHVFLSAPRSLGMSWNALVQLMRDAGHPSGAYFSEPRWEDRAWRLTREAKEQFRTHFEPFTRERTKEALTREAIARKIVMGPVSTVSDLFNDPQLAHRRFFTELAAADKTIRFPGAPYSLSSAVWSVKRAPGLGEHKMQQAEVRS